MIKITNAKLTASVNDVRVVANLALPVRTSFKLAKTIKALEAAIVPYRETYEKLTEQHIEKDADGKRIEVSPGQFKLTDPRAFDLDVRELLDLEVEIDADTISLSELDGQILTPNVLMNLDWLITE